MTFNSHGKLKNTDLLWEMKEFTVGILMR